jgi:hypothetical protein
MLRVQPFLALVLVALLAAVAAAPAAAPGALAFQAPVRTGANVGEPGLRIASDGTLFVHYPSGLIRSTDGGAHWTLDRPNPAMIEGGDADLAIAGDGSLLYGDLNFQCFNVYCGTFTISVARSTDAKGAGPWVQNYVASDLPDVDRQWLDVGKDAATGLETVYLAYNQANAGLRIVKSHTGGVAFEDAVTLPDNMPWSCFRGNLVATMDDSVYVADCTAAGPRVWASYDGGFTWAASEVDHHAAFDYDGFLFPNVATDAAGNVYASWAEREAGPNGTQTHVYVAASTDGGAHWGPKIRLTSDQAAGVMPWGAGGAADRLGVAFYEADQQGNADAMNATARWHVEYALVAGLASGAPSVTQAAASSDNVQVGPICGGGSGCSAHRNLLDFFQVRGDAQGLANIAFVEGCDPCTGESDSTASHVYFVKQEPGGPTLLG